MASSTALCVRKLLELKGSHRKKNTPGCGGGCQPDALWGPSQCVQRANRRAVHPRLFCQLHLTPENKNKDRSGNTETRKYRAFPHVSFVSESNEPPDVGVAAPAPFVATFRPEDPGSPCESRCVHTPWAAGSAAPKPASISHRTNERSEPKGGGDLFSRGSARAVRRGSDRGPPSGTADRGPRRFGERNGPL